MPDALADVHAIANPPIDYVVARWVGMPRDQILAGVREGWIRCPPGTTVAAPADAEEPRTDADVPVIGRSDVRSWLARLDPTLDDAAFERMWNEAGTSDVSRAASLTTFLADALGVSQRADAQTPSPASRIGNALDMLHGTAKIVRMDGRSGAELERLAHDEPGIRRALATHSPWAVTDHSGLARLSDLEGRFDRFDPQTGEVNLTDAWIGDRARHAAWQMADAQEAEGLHASGDGWRFTDRAAGPAVTIEIDGDTDVVHQVVFARDGGDHVVGGSTTDRMHGGTGDDVLRGRGGDDLLEGGHGADLLIGGSGRDDLVGQRGDDELEGGAGADRLDGGGGRDELDGGRGDDLLRGGQGDDVYRFESGDGNDVVEDDGGAIVLDEASVEGEMQRVGESWRNEEGSIRFALEDAGSTLVIESMNGVSSIRVRDWAQGAYGITLEGFDQAPGEDSDPPDEDVESADEDDGGPQEQTPALGELGNEAPWFDATDLSPPIDDADVAADIEVLATDPLGGATPIDAAALLRAFESWSVPAPPDILAGTSLDANAVSDADIADALVDIASDEADAELANLSGADAWRDLVDAPESLVRLPPDVVLQRTS